MKRLMKKLMSLGVLNSLALMMVIESANQACIWFFHQPEFPESAKKYQKHS